MSLIATLEEKVRQTAEQLLALKEENRQLQMELEKWRKEAEHLREMTGQEAEMLTEVEQMRAQHDLAVGKLEKIVRKISRLGGAE